MKKGSKKSSKIFSCSTCDYTTSRKSQWSRHILTAKHKMDKMDKDVDNKKGSAGEFVCACGKEYKFQSGLCKHRNKCSTTEVGTKNNNINYKCYDDVVKENIELKDEMNKMKDVLPILFSNIQNILKTHSEIIAGQNGETMIYTNNIYNNNKISINVFLNETCKNAMNLKEFIENLNVSLDDLQYTKDHGYVKGISNIFVKQLNNLEPTQRPIHCSDDKRLKFYIKEDDKWGKDKENSKLDKSINDLALKQIKKIKDWEEQHPKYAESQELLMEWHTMVNAVMGGEMGKSNAKTSESIKREIGQNVKLSNNMLNK
jgi:hypothetical protein